MVSDFASDLGHSIEVPDGFLAMVAERHQGEAKGGKKKTVSIDAEPTNLDFYEDMEKRSFSSEVVFSDIGQISLKNTLFYPEGGGQLSDTGVIAWSGKESQVVEVQKRLVHVEDKDRALCRHRGFHCRSRVASA